MNSLEGKVAVVAGASRGAGRGIACALGEAGAMVYCTGRSTRRARRPRRRKKGSPFELAGRPETIEETAEMVTARGGQGIAVRVDHTIDSQVKALFNRVKKDQGRLDVLVNDVWGGDELTVWGKPFWELPLRDGLLMIQRAVHSHIITSYYAAPLIIKHKQGLIAPLFVGRAVAALAADPNLLSKSGKVFSSWRLAREYDFHDADGQQPDWGRYSEGADFDKNFLSIRDAMNRSHADFLEAFR